MQRICNMFIIMRKEKLLSLVILLVCFTSCEMLETHPYDAHITGERDINAKNCQRIEDAMKGKKTFRFAMISDTQRWYDETEKAVKAINARGDIDFVLHGGDQSDFGATREFILMRDIMKGFNVPWVSILGNHDCLGTGEDVFKAIYGDPNYAFTAGNVRFICLNTNAMEYDYSEPVPDFEFIENELNNLSEEIEKTVFLMHVAPFDFIFNNNVAKIFQAYIHRFPNVQFCLYGHGHSLAVDDLFEDGLLYYQCPNIKKRTYLVFTFKEGTNDYEYEAVTY